MTTLTPTEHAYYVERHLQAGNACGLKTNGYPRPENREYWNVLELITRGFTNPQIAKQLNTNTNRVNTLERAGLAAIRRVAANTPQWFYHLERFGPPTSVFRHHSDA